MGADGLKEASGFISRVASLIRPIADQQQLSVQPSNLGFQQSGSIASRQFTRSAQRVFRGTQLVLRQAGGTEYTKGIGFPDGIVGCDELLRGMSRHRLGEWRVASCEGNFAQSQPRERLECAIADVARVANGLPFVLLGLTELTTVSQTDREVVMGFSQSSRVTQSLISWDRTLIEGDRVRKPITHVRGGTEIVQCTRSEQVVIIVARELEHRCESLLRCIELAKLELGDAAQIQHASTAVPITGASRFR